MSFSRGKLLLELARKKQKKEVEKERKKVSELFDQYENGNAFTTSSIENYNNDERDELSNLLKQTSDILNVYSGDHGNSISIENVAFNNNVILNSYSEDVDNYSSCSEDGNDNENTDGFSSETVVDFEVGTKDIISCDEREGNIITEDIEEKKGEGILVEEADEVMNEQKKTPRIRKSSDRIARDIRKHEIYMLVLARGNALKRLLKQKE